MVKVETYVLVNNEELLMPYFMRHYGQFSKVILLENSSTDRTVEIATSMGAEHWNFDREDEINDQWFMDIKNSCWKNSKADWVIICDVDEFVYHPDLPGFLKNTEYTAFIPRLFNMFHDKFPTTEGQIYDEVKMGKEGGGKLNLFRPSEIKEINYQAGAHQAIPKGNVKLGLTSDIKTLHMRWLGVDYVVNKHKRAASRLSMLNKNMMWGHHVMTTREDVIATFHNEMTNLLQVL